MNTHADIKEPPLGHPLPIRTYDWNELTREEEHLFILHTLGYTRIVFLYQVAEAIYKQLGGLEQDEALSRLKNWVVKSAIEFYKLYQLPTNDPAYLLALPTQVGLMTWLEESAVLKERAGFLERNPKKLWIERIRQARTVRRMVRKTVRKLYGRRDQRQFFNKTDQLLSGFVDGTVEGTLAQSAAMRFVL